MTTSYESRLGVAPEEGVKAPCVVSSSSNITLSGEQTVDGVAVVENDRVLVRSQTDPAENGIYNAKSGAWELAADFNAAQDLMDGMIAVDADSSIAYVLNFSGTYDPGVTSVTFAALLDSTT